MSQKSIFSRAAQWLKQVSLLKPKDNLTEQRKHRLGCEALEQRVVLDASLSLSVQNDELIFDIGNFDTDSNLLVEVANEDVNGDGSSQSSIVFTLDQNQTWNLDGSIANDLEGIEIKRDGNRLFVTMDVLNRSHFDVNGSTVEIDKSILVIEGQPGVNVELESIRDFGAKEGVLKVDSVDSVFQSLNSGGINVDLLQLENVNNVDLMGHQNDFLCICGNVNGILRIQDNNGLTISDPLLIGGDSGTSIIQSNSPLTISSDITTSTNLTLIAGDNAGAPGDDVTIRNGAVVTIDSATSRVLTIQAGDHVRIGDASGGGSIGTLRTINGTHSIVIDADHDGDADGVNGSVFQEFGAHNAIITDSLTITSGDGIGPVPSSGGGTNELKLQLIGSAGSNVVSYVASGSVTVGNATGGTTSSIGLAPSGGNWSSSFDNDLGDILRDGMDGSLNDDLVLGGGGVSYLRNGVQFGIIDLIDLDGSSSAGADDIELDPSLSVNYPALLNGDVVSWTGAGTFTLQDGETFDSLFVATGSFSKAIDGGNYVVEVINAGGIGSGVLMTSVSTLSLNIDGPSGINIENDKGGTELAINGVSDNGGGGDVNITNSSPLTVTADITVGGNLTLTASNSAGVGDDLTIRNNAVVTIDSAVDGKVLTLNAGDDIILGDAGTTSTGTARTIGGSHSIIVNANNDGAGDGDNGSVIQAFGTNQALSTNELNVIAGDGIGGGVGIVLTTNVNEMTLSIDGPNGIEIDNQSGAGLTLNNINNGGGGGDIFVQNNSSLVIDGDISAVGNTVRLAANGNISQNAGDTIAAMNLGVRQESVAGGIIELCENNVVDVFGASNAFNGGKIDFHTVQDLTVGNVSADPKGIFSATAGVATNNGDVLLDTDGTLTIDDAILAAGATVRLIGEGNITQNAGDTITAMNLGVRQESVAGGIIELCENNVVDVIAAFNAFVGGEIDFRSTQNLSIGTVASDGKAAFIATSGITANNGNVLVDTDGSLTIDQDIVAVDNTVRLIGNGNISQNAGDTIIASSLGVRQESAAAGDIELCENNVVNVFAASNAFAGGKVDFRTTQDLSVGTVGFDGKAVFTSTSGVTTNAGDVLLDTNLTLTIDQDILAGGASVRLIGNGNITQNAGDTITAMNLGVWQENAIGGIIELCENNVVDVFAAANDFNGGKIDFHSTQDLTIGSVSADAKTVFPSINGVTTNNGDILVGSNGSLVIDQDIVAIGNTVRLIGNGDISQGAGDTITAMNLGVRQESAAAGNIELEEDNVVDLFAANNAFNSGSISFNASQNLSIGTITSDGKAVFTATPGTTSNNGDIQIESAGTLTIDDSIAAGTANVLLVGNGNISQNAADTISADGLEVRQESALSGNVDLKEDNQVSSIVGSNLFNTGAFNFHSIVDLNVDSVISDGDIMVSSDGNLTIATITGPGTVMVNSLGSIMDDGDMGTKVAAENVSAMTGGSISMNTNTNSLNVMTTAAGDIDVTEDDGVDLQNVETFDGQIAITAGGNLVVTDVNAGDDGADDDNGIDLTTTAGDIVIQSIVADHDIQLNSANDIVDLIASNVMAGRNLTAEAARKVTLADEATDAINVGGLFKVRTLATVDGSNLRVGVSNDAGVPRGSDSGANVTTDRFQFQSVNTGIANSGHSSFHLDSPIRIVAHNFVASLVLTAKGDITDFDNAQIKVRNTATFVASDGVDLFDITLGDSFSNNEHIFRTLSLMGKDVSVDETSRVRLDGVKVSGNLSLSTISKIIQNGDDRFGIIGTSFIEVDGHSNFVFDTPAGNPGDLRLVSNRRNGLMDNSFGGSINVTTTGLTGERGAMGSLQDIDLRNCGPIGTDLNVDLAAGDQVRNLFIWSPKNNLVLDQNIEVEEFFQAFAGVDSQLFDGITGFRLRGGMLATTNPGVHVSITDNGGFMLNANNARFIASNSIQLGDEATNVLAVDSRSDFKIIEDAIDSLIEVGIDPLQPLGTDSGATFTSDEIKFRAPRGDNGQVTMVVDSDFTVTTDSVAGSSHVVRS